MGAAAILLADADADADTDTATDTDTDTDTDSVAQAPRPARPQQLLDAQVPANRNLRGDRAQHHANADQNRRHDK